MYEKFEFPLEVQRWIVRKRLVSDKETISSTRVKNDEELHLYLVPARSVGVTKESARAAYLGIPRQRLSLSYIFQCRFTTILSSVVHHARAMLIV